MKYPNAVTSVTLYDKTDAQLTEIVHRAVAVAEPKKLRIGLGIAIVVSAITIIGLPIAFILEAYREQKREYEELKLFVKLDHIRTLQNRHHIQETINVHWLGNAKPKFFCHGDTSLVWQACPRHPNCLTFDLDDLRAKLPPPAYEDLFPLMENKAL